MATSHVCAPSKPTLSTQVCLVEAGKDMGNQDDSVNIHELSSSDLGLYYLYYLGLYYNFG